MTEYDKFDRQDARAEEMKKVTVHLFEELVKLTESDDNLYRQKRMFNVTSKIEKLENLANEIVRLQGGEWL